MSTNRCTGGLPTVAKGVNLDLLHQRVALSLIVFGVACQDGAGAGNVRRIDAPGLHSVRLYGLMGEDNAK